MTEGELRVDVAENLVIDRNKPFIAARSEDDWLAAYREVVAALERVERKLENKGQRKMK